jgi:hypothetical protein
MKSACPLVCFAFCLTGLAAAAPVALLSAAELREDGRLAWGTLSAVHGTSVSTAVPLSTSDPGTTFTLVPADGATSLSIWNQPGAHTPGVLLENSGPGGIRLTPGRHLQAFAVTIEHRSAVQATYTLEFLDEADVRLGTISAPSAGDQGQPAFMGMLDPAARIAAVILRADPGSHFLLGDPLFQIPVIPEADPNLLPVISTATIGLSNVATYLHQGLNPDFPAAATLTATVDNPNAISLATWFPTLRAGDLLRFERLGYSLADGVTNPNPPLGVFTRSESIDRGTALRRLADPLDAGRDYQTPEVPPKWRGFATPTNIPEDFYIGDSTFVTVPAGARFLMFSLARPSPASSPLSVRVSHIQRDVFRDWLDSLGLHGPLADPESDLDGDGLNLLQEFAFQKDPTRGDANDPSPFSFTPRVFPLSSSPDRLALSFGLRTDAPLEVGAEFSADLIHWTPAAGNPLAPFLGNSDGTRAVFIAVDPGSGPTRFGRVSLRLSPEP